LFINNVTQHKLAAIHIYFMQMDRAKKQIHLMSSNVASSMALAPTSHVALLTLVCTLLALAFLLYRNKVKATTV
jgi:hypothetical protein